MKSLPFISKVTNEAPNGDRAVSDSDVRDIIKTVWGNGVTLVSRDGSDLQVVASNGMSVKVLKGGCVIVGAIGYQDKERIIKISPSHSSLKRMDRIVARLDLSEPVRSIELYLKEGTPSTTPVAPDLVRASNYYEIALADIRVKAGATEINNTDILDQRQNPEVCGFVQPAFPANFDLSAITDRYTELLEAALTDTVAGKIQSTISQVESKVGEIQSTISQVESKQVTLKNIKVSSNDAVSSTTYASYPYYIDVHHEHISGDYIATVYPPMDKADVFAQVCVTYAGYVRLYCKNNTFGTITMTIILTK